MEPRGPTHTKASKDAEELEERQGDLRAFEVPRYALDEHKDDGEEDERHDDMSSLVLALCAHTSHACVARVAQRAQRAAILVARAAPRDLGALIVEGRQVPAPDAITALLGRVDSSS